MFHLYGLLIALSLFLAYLICYFRRKKYALKEQDLDTLFLWVVPFGVVGARLYHVFDKWSFYQNNFWEIFAVWNGGLGIYGAMGGGFLGILIYNFKFKIPNFRFIQKTNTQNMLSTLDFIAPALLLGQSVGRWGNYFNHEVFGGPTNLPWKWFIPENLRPEYWRQFSYFHPTFAYESLWCGIGFLIIIFVEKNFALLGKFIFCGVKNDSSKINLSAPQNYPGLLSAFYLIWYGVGRFFLEFLRFDTARFMSINVAQVISMIMVALGVIFITLFITRRTLFITRRAGQIRT